MIQYDIVNSPQTSHKHKYSLAALQ